MSHNKQPGELQKKISELLLKSLPQGAAARATEAVTQPAREPQSGAEAASERRLRALLAKKSQIAAGRLQVLGLGGIRGHIGERWDAVAEKVDMLVERVLKKRLSSVDHFAKFDDEIFPAYVILFSALQKEEAQIKCALIANEIAEAVLGTDAPPDTVEVKTVVAMVEGASIAEDVNALDAIGQILAREAEKLHASPCGPAQAASDEVALESDGAVPDNLNFVYQPVWDVRRNVILTFRCVPVDRSAADRPKTGYDILGTGTPPPARFADLDIRVMEHMTGEAAAAKPAAFARHQRPFQDTCLPTAPASVSWTVPRSARKRAKRHGTRTDRIAGRPGSPTPHGADPAG